MHKFDEDNFYATITYKVICHNKKDAQEVINHFLTKPYSTITLVNKRKSIGWTNRHSL